jgi:hypothetical protein
MSIETGVCNKCAVSRGSFAHIVRRAVNRRIKESSCEFLSHAKKREHMLAVYISPVASFQFNAFALKTNTHAPTVLYVDYDVQHF